MVLAGAAPHTGEADSAAPFNFVIIMADDLDRQALELGFHRSLPERSALESDLIARGATFPNFIFPTALCCPSRASFLTGQYPHNHRVHGNNPYYDPDSNGGMYRFYVDERDRTSLGSWLQAAGYRTGFVGKYLNGYPDGQRLRALGLDETYVPRGWDEWHGTFIHDKPLSGDPLRFSFHHFRMNHNGNVVEHGPGSYLTHVERDLAIDFIDRRAKEPFLLYVAAYAPHAPVEPAPADSGLHAAAGVRGETGPACDEEDLSDKPAWLREATNLEHHGRCAVGSRGLDMTLAIDDLIAGVIAELDEQGLLDRTFVFFVSDNGMLRGQHHIAGKSAPYDESMRVPMVVRGPGVPAGAVFDHLVMNIDVAPTMLDLAGTTATPGSPPVDGESLAAVMTGATRTDAWRDGVLIEKLKTMPAEVPMWQPQRIPRFKGVRTAGHLLTEYETNEMELYDLAADPHQLDSMHATAPAELLQRLRSLLDPLADCAGAACATAARLQWVSVESVRFVDRGGGRWLPRAIIADRSEERVAAAAVTAAVKVGTRAALRVTASTNENGVARFAVVAPAPGESIGFCVEAVVAEGLLYDGAARCVTMRR